jgi:hypothetical protein
VLLATRNGAHVLPRTLGGYRCVATPTFGGVSFLTVELNYELFGGSIESLFEVPPKFRNDVCRASSAGPRRAIWTKSGREIVSHEAWFPASDKTPRARSSKLFEICSMKDIASRCARTTYRACSREKLCSVGHLSQRFARKPNRRKGVEGFGARPGNRRCRKLHCEVTRPRNPSVWTKHTPPIGVSL